MLRRLALAVLLGWALVAAAAPVAVVEMRGPISPASSEQLSRALDGAQAKGAVLLVLQLDTPGGLDTSMRDMIRAILASPVPVACYVAPSGARAASAGTYLMYASHIAAMAPGTNLGAATPVSIGLGGAEPEPASPRDKSAAKPSGKGADNAPPSSAESLRAKVMQDSAAYLRSLAQMRGRNAAWAEQAVLRSVSLSADEALKLKVIDLVAVDIADLLHQADGRTVRTAAGERRLALADAQVYVVERTWHNRLLGAVADPNVAVMLMMLGIYGLLFEFYNPGMALPGVAGAICLLLSAYGLHLLPVNYAGVLLMLVGVAFMVAEAFFPTFGALGVGGVVAFVAGALMLVDAQEAPGVAVSWQVVTPLGVFSALLLFGLGTMALRARRRPPVAGAEAMVGGVAEALEDFAGGGWVTTAGERWHGRCGVPLKRGEKLRIVRVDGLTLEVEPLKGDP
ncbi:MAG: nodulation protein NfeD [Rhodocyclaceae bacterium]|nr:nodulation protein NfeD [Rhodocyclaceae bacterium]